MSSVPSFLRSSVFTCCTIILWGSFACIAYSYIGYPVLIHCLAGWHTARRASPRPAGETTPQDSLELPKVTVLIAAHNSASHIRQRISNLLDSDYPDSQLEILIASDGSTDGTVAAAQAFARPNIRVLDFPQRRGKAATLMAAIPHVDSEVIVFTDASTQFEPTALRRLGAHFHDRRVGIVAGRVAMLDERGTPAESLYWRSEMQIRRSEARLGLLVGASGAIYAMRRDLFVSPTRPIINDDLVFPLLSQLEHGCGCILEEGARAVAVSCGGWGTEFRRRCRIGAGGYQSLSALRSLFRLKNWRTAGVFVSHKLLRWLCPFWLIAMLLSNLGLLVSPGYQQLLVLQAGAYLLAILGLFAPNWGPLTRLCRTASSFLVMNVALLAGFVQWLLDSQGAIWTPTARPVLGGSLGRD